MSNREASCPLCHKRTDVLLTDRLRRGHGRVFHCIFCDHAFLIPDTTTDPKKYYAEEYRQEYSHEADGSTTHPQEIFDIYSRFQTERLETVDKHLHADTRLLEIGASAGQFLVHILDRIAVANAIEPDPECCVFIESHLGVATDAKLLNESTFASGSYDVICSFHVMEHVESPVDFLKNVRAALVPGGTAFVEIPNLRDSLLSVWDVGAYHDFYYRDAHLHYFTEQSARLVANKAGFSKAECSVKYLQDYNLLNHLNWITNGSAQATCEVGLSPIDLAGTDPVLTEWLSQRLRELDEEYRERLVIDGITSNLMLILSKGSTS